MSEKLVFKVILDQVPIHHLEVVEKKKKPETTFNCESRTLLLKAGK